MNSTKLLAISNIYGHYIKYHLFVIFLEVKAHDVFTGQVYILLSNGNFVYNSVYNTGNHHP